MATVGVQNGTNIRLYYNTTGSTYVAVGNSQTVRLNFTHSPRETTSQDSAGHADFLEGKRMKTVDFSALDSEDGAENFKTWYDLLDSETTRGLVVVRVNSTVSGDVYYQYSGYLTNLTRDNGGPEGNVTFDGSIQVTGKGTTGTVA